MDLTRLLQMLWMTLQMEKMIRKSRNILYIRKPGVIRRAILGCVTATLENYFGPYIKRFIALMKGWLGQT